MKKFIIYFYISIITLVLLTQASCKKYLDSVYANPNKPTQVDASVAWPSIITVMPRGILLDSRFINRYVQYFAHTTASTTWDAMGYDVGTDNGCDQWRTHYYSFGQNLLNVIADGRNGRYEFAGAGWALFAWSWMVLTDNHGEVILKEAFNPSLQTFHYDKQQEVYEYAKQLTDSAIYYLNLAKNVPSTSFQNADAMLYTGNIDKWIKFTYGVRAMIFHRYIKKADYKADSVIANVDRSFASNADNATVKFTGNLFTEGLNFWGPTRNNMGSYRQSNYVINLLNGTILGAADPRLKYLFKASDSGRGSYTGLQVTKGLSSLTTKLQPPNFWGTYSTAAPTTDTGARHFFKNLSPFPVITYPELQFIKAEAALKKGDAAMANTAYMNGINGSFDLLTATGLTGYTPITTTDRSTYLASPGINPGTGVAPTLSQIMVQKYIALYPYGAEETWVDMRKNNYDTLVYPKLVLPSPFYNDNNNKPAYRIRPRYNSEYLWNFNELVTLGADKIDYHTMPVWFMQP